MSKSNRVRAVLRRHDAVFTGDVAEEVGCTQPLVFQIISAMKDEGEIFDERQVRRQKSYRLLTGAEAEERRTARRKFEKERQRGREVAKLREQLIAARSSIEDALQRLDTLTT